jgi:hypothetical protein
MRDAGCGMRACGMRACGMRARGGLLAPLRGALFGASGSVGGRRCKGPPAQDGTATHGYDRSSLRDGERMEERMRDEG